MLQAYLAYFEVKKLRMTQILGELAIYGRKEVKDTEESGMDEGQQI